MELRQLVVSSGMVAAALLLPFIILFALLGHPDVVRGLLLGLVAGLLNSLLLARKLDRAIDGRDPWQNLTRTMPRNMLTRFALILGLGLIGVRLSHVNLAGMVAGLALCIVVGAVYAARSTTMQWKKEDGVPVYERARVVRS